MSESKDVFISYSTKDQTAKDELKIIFEKANVTYFLDEKSLEVGKNIENSLIDNLNQTMFTVLLVSQNSLFSTWVCLECIHRLRQEEFEQRTSLLPILIDMSVMDVDFPLEMVNNFKNKHQELEKLRAEALANDLPTKVYNDEIERIDEIIPQIGEIIQKIKNGLSANFTDPNRKEKDMEKILATILERKKNEAEKSSISQKNERNQTISQRNNQLKLYIGAGVGAVLLLFFLMYFVGVFDGGATYEQNADYSDSTEHSQLEEHPENQPNNSNIKSEQSETSPDSLSNSESPSADSTQTDTTYQE
jgi:hypothetical protein